MPLKGAVWGGTRALDAENSLKQNPAILCARGATPP